MTTSAVELGLYDLDLMTKLAILPAVDPGLYFELNQPGGGECRVHTLRSVASGLIQRGQFVRVTYRGAVQGGFFVENIGKTESSQGESADLWTPIKGRGPMKMLETAIVWSDGTDASTRDFTDQPKAAMLIALIEEAKARGNLSVLTYDFTASVDSNSVAWTDSETMQFSVGKTLLEVVREICDFGIDMNMVVNANGTFTLKAYANGRGSDKSTTIYFRRGVNCEEITTDEQGMEFSNALLLKHNGGYVTANDAASIAEFGRVEKMVDAHDAGNSANALRYGQALLEVKSAPKKETSMQMFDGVPPYVFTDYDIGDWITKDISGVTEKLRVRSIQLNWQDAEKADVTVGLNTEVIENEIKQQNDIRKLYEMIRRQNDGQEVRLPFWAAIGKLSNLATEGTAVYAMAVSDAGKLYVVGNITKIGNVTVNNAAVYDIETGQWSKLGTGFDGIVNAIACNGTKIYFGGLFTVVDGQSCPNMVACWDEETEGFIIPSVGFQGVGVYALKVDGDRLYVGGQGVDTIITDPYCIGYLTISTDVWTDMLGILTDVSPTVHAIETNGTRVYLGTDATGGVYLYAWDTGTEIFTSLALALGPTYGAIYTMSVYNDKLFIGGNFPDLGDAGIVRAAWMNLGTEAITAFDVNLASGEAIYSSVVSDSDLIIGGIFSTLGPDAVDCNNIGIYNDSIFQMMTTGTNGTVYALTAYQGNIGAGGVFTTAGGKPIKYVGAYITDLSSILEYLETGNEPVGETMLADNAVTNAKLADMAEGTVKARLSTGTGDPEDATLAALAAALGIGAQTPKRVVITDPTTGEITTSDYVAYDDTTKILTLGEAILGYVQSVIWNLSSGASRMLNMITYGTGLSSRFKGTFARGTIDAAMAAQSGDTLARFSGAGYDGNTSIQNAATSGELRVEAAENFDSTHHGTNLGLWITLPGTTTMIRVGTFTQEGLNLEAGYEFLINNVPLGSGNGFQVDCSGGTSDTYGVLSGAINGVNKVFTVSLGSYVSGALQVYLNGQLQTQGTGEDWVETSPAAGTFTVDVAPVAGDIITVFYKHSVTATYNADTLDGYEAATLMQNPQVGRGTVEVDFGTGDLYKIKSVTNALALVTSIITANISYKPTANNSADDIMVQPMEVKVGNRSTGGFDITVLSLLGKIVGKVNVDYILFN